MRIMICVVETSGFFVALKTGLQKVGCDTSYIDLGHNPNHYGGSDQANWMMRRLDQCAARLRRTPRRKVLVRIFWYGLWRALLALLFLWALPRYDAFIFGRGQSFFFPYDLFLLKHLGKRILFVFLGSDLRPPYINGAILYAENRAFNTAQVIRHARALKTMIRLVERYADVVVSHPTYGQFQEKPFVNFSYIGLASTLPENLDPAASATPPQAENRPARIVHAPSRLASKGTPGIRQAIEQLTAKGHAIDFIEVAGQSNHAVLEALANSDFAVDQLYADALMGGFGREAALLGKPVVIGTYGIAHLPDWASPEMTPPVQACHPDEIEQAIEKLILDTAYRHELGQKARHFVQTQWADHIVARRFVRLLQGDIPAEWMCDPYRITYAQGYGLTTPQLQQALAQVIGLGGQAALQLADKPSLEQKFMKLAGL